MAEDKVKPEEMEPVDVGELEEGQLEDVSGGGFLSPNQTVDDNTNCGNTQCCG